MTSSDCASATGLVAPGHVGLAACPLAATKRNRKDDGACSSADLQVVVKFRRDSGREDFVLNGKPIL